MKSKFIHAAGLAALLLASGCTNVKPWERGNLTNDTMQPNFNPIQITQAKHVWFSREQATGGGGVGGGGCGCN